MGLWRPWSPARACWSGRRWPTWRGWWWWWPWLSPRSTPCNSPASCSPPRPRAGRCCWCSPRPIWCPQTWPTTGANGPAPGVTRPWRCPPAPARAWSDCSSGWPSRALPCSVAPPGWAKAACSTGFARSWVCGWRPCRGGCSGGGIPPAMWSSSPWRPGPCWPIHPASTVRACPLIPPP